MFKALDPQGLQRTPVPGVRRFQRPEVGALGGVPIHRQRHLGQARPSQYFAKPEPGDSAIEVEEWMEGQEAALGEGERLACQGPCQRGQGSPSSSEVAGVVPQQDGHVVGCGWSQMADLDLDGPTAAGPFGYQVAANASVKLHEELIVEGPAIEGIGDDRLLAREDPFGEERR